MYHVAESGYVPYNLSVMSIALNRDVLVAQNPEPVARAQRYYDPGMEYHNFDHHVLGVWEEARGMAAYCEGQGVPVDLEILDPAVLFHDANVHRPLRKRYPTYERWAGAIARTEVMGMGYETHRAEEVRKAIVATTFGVPPRSLEAAILKRADIANVGASYATFISNGVKIFREQMRTKGLSPTRDVFEQWQQTTCAFLLGHLRDDEPFGDFDLSPLADVPMSPFKVAGLENIRRLTTETFESLLGKIGVSHEHED